MTTRDRYTHYLLGNYAPAPLTLVRGQGVHVWDDTGKRYLDFGSGIAVTAIGHSHPRWVKAIQDQAATLAHISNLFANEPQGRLAEAIVQRAGPGRAFFCNSGTEANEALIKLARLHGGKLAGAEGKRYKILCAENAFHGRTFGGMSATPQAKIQQGFAPLLDGFAFGKLNDLASFEALIDEQTTAIFIETIQGESGIHPATPDFLQGLRDLCDRHQLLLMLDEVQCGVGRTGRFFAWEHTGITPDAIGMAKGLGGGFPIGAVWVADPYKDLFTPGSHGTTFGGNPLACAAALAVLDTIEQEQLLDHVRNLAPTWHQSLHSLADRHPDTIAEVRTAGFMIGLGLKVPHLPIVAAAREAGLLVIPAGAQTIRLLPPLNATQDDLQTATSLLGQALRK